MMEPDVRIKTNRQGFCRTHYDMMFVRKNRLGMALTLESHLNELKHDLAAGGLGGMIGGPGAKPMKRIETLEHDCYICERINYHFDHMIETAVLLWEQDEAFAPKLQKQPYFCLPHYRRLLEYARMRLPKKQQGEFVKQAATVVESYLEALSGDVSWFCKKFYYRYEEEPWGNAKDAVERRSSFCAAICIMYNGKQKHSRHRKTLAQWLRGYKDIKDKMEEENRNELENWHQRGGV